MSNKQNPISWDSPTLSIQLASPADWTYTAGDTVIGTVTRREFIVAPHVTINVRLRGRATSSWTVNSGTGFGDGYQRVTHSSNFEFFQTGDGPPTQVLYDGPLHVAKDVGRQGQSWPFALTIPTSAGVAPPGDPKARCYLSLDPEELPLQAAPASFAVQGGVGKVEYFIEACLRLHDEDSTRFGYANPEHCSQNGSKFQGFLSHKSIILRGPPIAVVSPCGWTMQTHDSERTVTSYRLLSGVESSKLSMWKKMKQSMKSSSVPRLAYTVRVGAPSQIHIDHPKWFPLTIQVIPDDMWTSDAIRDATHKAALTQLELTIMSYTTLLASAGQTCGMQAEYPIDLGPAMKSLPDNADHITIPLEFGTSAKPTDIGAILKLRWTSRGLFAGETCLSNLKDFQPAFTTYNIKQEQSFHIKFRLSIVGEAESFYYELDTEILPPSGAEVDPVPR